MGLYGINGLRKTKFERKTNIETICDMLAAASGLLMGQRGQGFPIVKISGVKYEFDPNGKIRDAIN